jgi:hypothetical protein
MSVSPILGIPIIGDVWDAVTGVFTDVAGWALDGVISLITSWVVGGVLALIEAMWSVIDTSTSPSVDAEWFSATGSSPFQMAVQIGAVMLSITVLLSIIRAVLAGSPGAVLRTVAHDLPLAVFAMVATVGITRLGLDLTDAMSDWVWALTRDDAKRALEALSLVMMTGLPGTHFLGVVLAVVLLIAMLFLWVVLFIREALIYLVVVFGAAFAWPALVFAPLRDTAKRSLELLAALIVAKPVITLALSVGVSALAGVGATGEPGDPAGGNVAGELGTLVVGVVTFGLAAFMPYVVWKLMPVVAAAVVAQGIASGPLRAGQTAMQVHYMTATMTRLATGGATAAAGKGARPQAEPATADRRPQTGSATDRLAGVTR